jgi:CUB/sushi domain-containing protein
MVQILMDDHPSCVLPVVTCPVLEPPTNGYFVKESCSNVLNAACGVRCKFGYELQGSSVRLCQLNGTWSGTEPRCLIKSCQQPKPVADGEMRCVHETEKFVIFIKYDEDGRKIKETKTIHGDERFVNKTDRSTDFIIDTECSFTCSPGFSLVGSSQRTCLPLARWDGLQTTCKRKFDSGRYNRL